MLHNGRDTWNSRGGGASWYAEFDASSFSAVEDPAVEDSRGIAGARQVLLYRCWLARLLVVVSKSCMWRSPQVLGLMTMRE
jgi:hypothetical protein